MTLKPRPLAIIREEECIGCAKCIEACPVDAILGSARHMHTVIAEECIGCKLCLPPCPVDCIDLFTPASAEIELPQARKQKAAYIKQRYTARQQRLQNNDDLHSTHLNSIFSAEFPLSLDQKKTYVQDAVARARLKKSKVISQ